MNYPALNLIFDPFPFLKTQRLSLRKVDPRDVQEVFYLRSDPGMLKYLDKPPDKTKAESAVFIDRINKMEKEGEAITWAITISGDDKLIGTICFWKITTEHFRAEIGYALHQDWQGKGIMQEAMEAVLQYGFKSMHLHSVEANVNPQNDASIKLLQRNGFTREGYFKENYFFDGKFLDSAIYSLLRKE